MRCPWVKLSNGSAVAARASSAKRSITLHGNPLGLRAPATVAMEPCIRGKTTGRPPCDVAATSLGEGEGDPSVRVRRSGVASKSRQSAARLTNPYQSNDPNASVTSLGLAIAASKTRGKGAGSRTSDRARTCPNLPHELSWGKEGNLESLGRARRRPRARANPVLFGRYRGMARSQSPFHDGDQTPRRRCQDRARAIGGRPMVTARQDRPSQSPQAE